MYSPLEIKLQVGCDQQYFNCCLASTQILIPGHLHFAYIWPLCQVMALTHSGLMTHIYIGELCHHWFR